MMTARRYGPRRNRTLGQYLSDGLPTRRFDGRDIFIYAYVSPSDVVVYVGRTWHPSTRHGAHRANAAWWTPDLTFAVVDVVTGWENAKAAEAKAIRELAPVANIAHNRRAAA